MKRIYGIGLLMLGFLSANAQEEDLGLWTAVGIEKKLSPRFSLKLEENLRLNDNITRIDQTFTNLGVQFKVSKHFRVAGYYRFIQKKSYDKDYISLRHRAYLDLILRFKASPILFVNRLRLQTQVQDVHTSELGRFPESRTRNKLDIKLDLDKRYGPYISGELFYQIRDPRNESLDKYFSAVRYALGVDYELTYRSTLGLYYLLQTTLNDAPELKEYIIGIEYSFEF